ncbi:hypothetical protein SLS62_007716 [Diatrype stigma]|uniref:Interferon-induced GTP-binding protein Mx2 n=1 Tax=Diatrype stigma TaxID=117547 RepID=A0AAN9UKZ3_9PEZI
MASHQLVVVGDQSSGKSSVLEGLTGFAFPRAAELCTRYVTQITCRRETEESITVSIIPNTEANPHEQERVKRFHRTLTAITPDALAELFRDTNEAMGIRTASKATSANGSKLPAFSEHVLKIEKHGPSEEHFTVIDVPGIFRKETEGLTEESDIELVMNMVKNYMHDSRTIILAIMPCNTDPATQEILKLAKKADPTMTRTMAVLTKPDLAIERAMQQIAIDHVQGKRSDLTLGYYVVKNRGSDDSNMTLQEGQIKERQFFSQSPWSTLSSTGRAGMDNLKVRVRNLLIDLIKREFPKLRAEVARELRELRENYAKMGPSRSNEHTQRAYLNKMSEAFQSLSRNALNAYYNGDKIFNKRHDLRLITRIVETSEEFNRAIEKHGHVWSFAVDPGSPQPPQTVAMKKFLSGFLNLNSTKEILGAQKSYHGRVNTTTDDISEEYPELEYPELEDVLDFNIDVDSAECDANGPVDNIMDYIEKVYKSSRGQDLGTFPGSLLATIFKEQSAKWEVITLSYIGHVILMVHHFISEVIREICPDPKVFSQLWDYFLLEELQKSYTRAMDQAKWLLEIEREGNPMTMNHYFNDNLQKEQSERLVTGMQKLLKSSKGAAATTTTTSHLAYDNWLRSEFPPHEQEEEEKKEDSGVFVTWSQLKNSLPLNKSNAQHVREYMHDVLKSYYKVARKRFVDVVRQQAVDYFLLRGPGSPLRIFTTELVLGLNADQLDMIAAEDAPVRDQRERLAREIESFEEALKVLKGSG